mmetsp:Transcript_6586/g.19952  ORF Transcript_6586/g.19952 Transcript_6586/m.19952 type:complete len:751 (+) Transcript_6586:82-2334(+)
MEEIVSDVARLGGVDNYVDRLLPSLAAVKSEARVMAERVAWEASAAEEDLRGGGEKLSDFVPAAQRFLRRGKDDMREFKDVMERACAEKERRMEALKELKRLSEEVIQSRQEEAGIRVRKCATDQFQQFQEAVSKMHGPECVRTFTALQATLHTARESGSSALVQQVAQMCTDAVHLGKQRFENDLRQRLEAIGFPLKYPPPQSIPDLQYIRADLEFLDAWQVATKDTAATEQPQLPKYVEKLSSWSMQALLRDAIARYRYHFCSPSSTLSDPNHPEWPADYTVAQLKEAIPFLRQIWPRSDVEYANALLAEFKRSVISNSHAAENPELVQRSMSITMALDLKVRALRCDGITSPLVSLMSDEWFMTTWAAAKMSDREEKATRQLEEQLQKSYNEEEGLCVLDAVEAAEETCSMVEQYELRSKLFRLMATPIFGSLRSALRAALPNTEDINIMDLTDENFRLCCRATSLASSFHQTLQELHETSTFLILLEPDADAGNATEGTRDEPTSVAAYVKRFAKEASDLSATVTRCIVDRFKVDMVSYSNSLRYAELPAPDPSTIYAHDPSSDLTPGLMKLDKRLQIVKSTMGDTLAAAKVWRAAAKELDKHIFENIVLLAFIGGDQGSFEVANKANDYLSDKVRGFIVRQMCYDLSVLVSTFKIFTKHPARSFKHLSEATTLLILSVTDSLEWEKNEDRRELLAALEKLSNSSDQDYVAYVASLLKKTLRISELHPREAREMLVISGMLLPPLC